MVLIIICLIFVAQFYILFTTMMINKTRAKLTKEEIKRRRKYLTSDGYSFIIMAVQSIHGKLLSKRTVDAYLRSEKVPKTGKRRTDTYGILPLFETVTTSEMEKRQRHSNQLSKQLEQ